MKTLKISATILVVLLGFEGFRLIVFLLNSPSDIAFTTGMVLIPVVASIGIWAGNRIWRK